MRIAHLVLPLSLTVMSLPVTAQPAPDLSAFAYKLLAEVGRTPGNTCVSPWSIAIALGMARAGAEGDTAHEIDAALGLKDDVVRTLSRLASAAKPRQIQRWVDGRSTQVDAYALHGANAAWLATNAKLLPDYARVMENDFKAPTQRVDFRQPKARTTINDWVLRQTKDRIRDLLPAGKPDPDTRLVLVNCLFLKAAWADQFEPEFTQPLPFSLADSTKVDVVTMRRTRSFGYAETKQMQIVELPFEGGDLSMLFAVPRDGVALDDVSAELAANWAALSQTKSQLVALNLPRFTFETSAALNQVLRALGVRAAFDREHADFSRMTPKDDPVFISDVLHKTFIKLDENGTEAAAATAVMMAVTSAVRESTPPSPILVRADRPFLFAIKHANAGVLFVGRVSDPR